MTHTFSFKQVRVESACVKRSKPWSYVKYKPVNRSRFGHDMTREARLLMMVCRSFVAAPWYIPCASGKCNSLSRRAMCVLSRNVRRSALILWSGRCLDVLLLEGSTAEIQTFEYLMFGTIRSGQEFGHVQVRTTVVVQIVPTRGSSAPGCTSLSYSRKYMFPNDRQSVNFPTAAKYTRRSHLAIL